MSALATRFRSLHAGPELLILPNAWDAGSARVIEKAGAKAIATSSAAVAWGHGYPDGQFLPFETLLATVREIVRVVDVPVTADIESGYAATAQDAGENVGRVIDAGAVGINIEDGSSPPELLCAKIDKAKSVALKSGVHFWINARIDVYIRGLASGEAAYAETVRRAALYRSAGADSVFVPALVDGETIARLVQTAGLPLNVLAWPGLPDAARLHSIGVRRLSAGAGLGKVALNQTYVLAKTFLAEGRAEALSEFPLELSNLNAVMHRD